MQLRASLLLLSLVLISCTGQTPQEASAPTYQSIGDRTYTMQIFDTWQEIPSKDVDTATAPHLLRIFESPQAIAGIYSKLSIIQEELLLPTTSLAYADENILDVPRVTPGYLRMQLQERTIGGERTLVHIYQGQSTALDPKMLFIQAHLVLGGTRGYTITFSLSPTVEDFTPYLTLLDTFRSMARSPS